MDTVPATDRARLTLHQYAADMLSLESNIEESLDAQVREVREHPGAAALLRKFHDQVKVQREAIRQHVASLQGPTASPGAMRGGATPQDVISMGSELFKTAVGVATGMAAGWINLARTQSTAKSLRDDYTAFNHAAVGYAMLLTTAKVFEFQPTAEIAERHLAAYERALDEIAGMIPEVVAWELRRDGHLFEERRIGAAAQTLSRVWRTGHATGGEEAQRAA
jgi:hypothetical protein